MSPVGVGFGVALGVAAMLAGKSPQRVPSVACAAMLGAGWAVAVTTAPIANSVPEVMLVWAGMDAAFGAIVAVLWSRYLSGWLISLAFLYFAQCFCHVLFWTGHIPQPSLYNYQLWVNILLAVQIWCIAWPGAERVANRLLDVLFPVPRSRARAGPEKRAGK